MPLSKVCGKVSYKFALEQATKTPGGGEVEVELYSFFNLGPRSGWVVNATPRPLYPRERDMIFAAYNVPFWFCAEDNNNIFATAAS